MRAPGTTTCCVAASSRTQWPQVEALAENVDGKRAAAESRVQLCKDKLGAGRQTVLDAWAEAARYLLSSCCY